MHPRTLAYLVDPTVTTCRARNDRSAHTIDRISVDDTNRFGLKLVGRVAKDATPVLSTWSNGSATRVTSSEGGSRESLLALIADGCILDSDTVAEVREEATRVAEDLGLAIQPTYAVIHVTTAAVSTIAHLNERADGLC